MPNTVSSSVVPVQAPAPLQVQQAQVHQHHQAQVQVQTLRIATPVVTNHPATSHRPLATSTTAARAAVAHAHTTHNLHVNHASQHQQQHQHQPFPHSHSLTHHTWTTDHVSEARRRMNTLIQRQQQAQDEFKLAQEAFEIANTRVKASKATIEMTANSVHQGTEELTDALLQEPTHWNAMYRKLAEYRSRNGHANVKRNPGKATIDREAACGGLGAMDPDSAKLGSWVGRVRLEARRPAGHPDHIEPYKVIALNRLGFNWDPRENYWMERYDELKEYMDDASNRKRSMPTRKTQLGVWCDGQVQEFNKFVKRLKPCYITQERIDLLNAIGFVWDRVNSAWNKSYNDLKNYCEIEGHCHVPVNYGDKTLFRWMTKQRKKYKNYKEGLTPILNDQQVKLLDEIDFFESADKRMAKYNAQKSSDRRRSRSRGRPKSTTLIPAEAQTILAGAQLAPVPMNLTFPGLAQGLDGTAHADNEPTASIATSPVATTVPLPNDITDIGTPDPDQINIRQDPLAVPVPVPVPGAWVLSLLLLFSCGLIPRPSSSSSSPSLAPSSFKLSYPMELLSSLSSPLLLPRSLPFSPRPSFLMACNTLPFLPGLTLARLLVFLDLELLVLPPLPLPFGLLMLVP
mmetsp:Transcript_8914/g.12759  ORF Transcript_8914/g.12759 Transcript_8914/m.12759 type:complete len:628 (+) Transcript_8914:2-1885(+)